MPKRKRSGEIVIEKPSDTEGIVRGSGSESGTVNLQPWHEERPMPSGSPEPSIESQWEEALPTIDAAAQELLEASHSGLSSFGLDIPGGSHSGPAALAHWGEGKDVQSQVHRSNY